MKLLSRIGNLRIALMLLASLGCGWPATVGAQELLVNRNFESPVVLSQGNNLYATLTGWTLSNKSPPQSLPINLVKPYAGIPGNPQAPATGGGSQYLDIASASGTISQSVTLAGSGKISISGWFSVRDSRQALSGNNIRVRTSGGTTVASATTSFLASDPIGLWKQASATNISLAAGTYTFEADVPNNAKLDLVSLVVTSPPDDYQDEQSAVGPGQRHREPQNDPRQRRRLCDQRYFAEQLYGHVEQYFLDRYHVRPHLAHGQ